MCNCQSYNRPDLTGSVEPVVIGYRQYFPDSAHETVCVDACIAAPVEALWRAGIRTTHSCCGHNSIWGSPSVAVIDVAQVLEAAHILQRFRPDWRLFVDLPTPPQPNQGT